MRWLIYILRPVVFDHNSTCLETAVCCFKYLPDAEYNLVQVHLLEQLYGLRVCVHVPYTQHKKTEVVRQLATNYWEVHHPQQYTLMTRSVQEPQKLVWYLEDVVLNETKFDIKLKVYKAVLLPALLYACETWTVYAYQSHT